MNCLSNKKDFILSLSDKYFDVMINNSNYNDNTFVEIEEMKIDDIPKKLLIKDNKLTNKINKILEEIFDLYSSNGKMSKSQSIEFIKEINRNDDEDEDDIDEYINKSFSV